MDVLNKENGSSKGGEKQIRYFILGFWALNETIPFNLQL